MDSEIGPGRKRTNLNQCTTDAAATFQAFQDNPPPDPLEAKRDWWALG